MMINPIQVTPIPSYSYALLTPYGALSLDPTTLNGYILAVAGFLVLIGIIYLVHRFKLVSKLWKWMESTKTPLWFIIAMVSSLFPLLILLITLPLTMGEMMIYGHITYPDWASSVIAGGLAIVGFFDLALAMWAYCAWKWDHFIPWMQRKTKKVSRNKHGQIDEL